VEVLENSSDNRYRYFNDKIHEIMVRKEVIEQMHKTTPGVAPHKETLEMAIKRDMASKKSEMDLQLYLQKEAISLSNVKDLVKKAESLTERKFEQIEKGIKSQDSRLEERMQSRRLRSISRGGKDKNPEETGNFSSRANYQANYLKMVSSKR
jgi:hypothetical protein